MQPKVAKCRGKACKMQQGGGNTRTAIWIRMNIAVPVVRDLSRFPCDKAKRPDLPPAEPPAALRPGTRDASWAKRRVSLCNVCRFGRLQVRTLCTGDNQRPQQGAARQDHLWWHYSPSLTHHHTTRPHDNLSLAMSRELNRGRRRAHSPGFCRLVRHAPESSVVTFGRRNCVGQGWVRDRQKIRGIDVYMYRK